jgi:hypothetical protein
VQVEIIDTGLGMAIVVVAALLASVAWARIVSTWRAVACATAFPVGVSLAVYFLPVVAAVLRTGVAEGSADLVVEAALWYFVFGAMTLPPGVFASLASTLLVRSLLRRRKARAS